MMNAARIECLVQAIDGVDRHTVNSDHDIALHDAADRCRASSFDRLHAHSCFLLKTVKQRDASIESSRAGQQVQREASGRATGSE